MLMGYREYARHRGVSLGAVQKALGDGRISATAEKKIDSAAADRDWQNNTDGSRVAVNAVKSVVAPAQKQISFAAPAEGEGDSPTRADGEPPPADELTGADRSAKEYRGHRATRERYVALTSQLEYEQLVGQLINVADAKRIAYTAFRTLRDSVLNVSARIKDQLAAETDPDLCEQLLESELVAALAGIDVGNFTADQDE